MTQISSRMIVWPETPTYFVDAELCARLCRRTRNTWDSRWQCEQILWDTVTIKRYPQAVRIEDEDYDEIVITGQVQEAGGRGPRS